MASWLNLSTTLQSWLPLALIAGGIYLGFLEKSKNQIQSIRRTKLAVGIALILAGVFLPSFFPSTKSKDVLIWENYTPESLTAAKNAGQPVIVGFYADWCIPCHELHQFTFADPKVIKVLASFSKMKVDVTRMDAPQAYEAIHRFGVIGVPTLLFLDSKGQEIQEARVTGFIPPKELIAIIQSPRFRTPHNGVRIQA